MRFVELSPLLLTCAASAAFAQSWIPQTSGTTASLRGVSAVDSKVVWASGSGGAVLQTVNGGATWYASIVPGAADLDFRGVRALDANNVWLMSSGTGKKSRIFHTADGGSHWVAAYDNPDADGFLDGMAWWDARRGVLLGDPVGGQFVLLVTEDAGQTWQRRKLPPALAGEGAFAASNSSLVVRGQHEIWFGTGGPTGGRVFNSTDDGWHWTIASTPVRHDGAGAGIFSLALSDAGHGIAMGGDYGKPADAAGNVAATADGGRTWALASGTPPGGYRSAVLWLAGWKAWITVGTSGSDISRDGGANWKMFDGGDYNALGAAGDAVWAVGPKGRIAKLGFR